MENNNQELNNQVNTNNSQQVQSNNKILIILMALIIVGLAGYIVYAKFIQKGDNPEPKPTNTEENGNNGNTSNQNDDSANYDAWMNYLLKQNITKITYEPGIDYENGGYAPVKEVSLDTLKAFFKEFKSHNYKLIKENVQGRGEGANYINITYVKNGVEYKFSLDDTYWTEGNNDSDFMNALESMGYKEEGFEGYPLSSIWYIFRDEVEDENTDISRFEKYYAKFFK